MREVPGAWLRQSSMSGTARSRRPSGMPYRAAMFSCDAAQFFQSQPWRDSGAAARRTSLKSSFHWQQVRVRGRAWGWREKGEVHMLI